MSHSTVLVIGPRTEDELEKALAPFDENIEVPEYVEATKEQIIAKEREHLAWYRDEGPYAKFLAGPVEYIKTANKATLPEHVAYLAVEFPKKLTWTDEQLYAAATQHDELDADGARRSTYNPKSRWDWYAIGGRWHRNLHLKDGAEVSAHHGEPSWANPDPDGDGGVNFVDRISDLDLDKTTPTFAVLTPDGEWHERGRMGWFGMVADERDEDTWSPQWRALVESHADQPAFLVDVHI